MSACADDPRTETSRVENNADPFIDSAERVKCRLLVCSEGICELACVEEGRRRFPPFTAMQHQSSHDTRDTRPLSPSLTGSRRATGVTSKERIMGRIVRLASKHHREKISALSICRGASGLARLKKPLPRRLPSTSFTAAGNLRQVKETRNTQAHRTDEAQRSVVRVCFNCYDAVQFKWGVKAGTGERRHVRNLVSPQTSPTTFSGELELKYEE